MGRSMSRLSPRRFDVRPPRGIRRHVLTADILDDRLLASLIVRCVRASRGPAHVSIHGERSIPTRVGHAGPITTSSPLGRIGRSPALTDERWSEAVHTLFAEVACRRVHTLAVEESRRERDQNSPDAS
jgi:hypothetical protein